MRTTLPAAMNLRVLSIFPIFLRRQVSTKGIFKMLQLIPATDLISASVNNPGSDSESRQTPCKLDLGPRQLCGRPVLTVTQGSDEDFTGDAVRLPLFKDRSNRRKKLNTRSRIRKPRRGQLRGGSPSPIRPAATDFLGNREKRTPEILRTIVQCLGGGRAAMFPNRCL
jgi:hypothetical protein